MRDIFSLFYAVMFGALLSAEIGTYARFNLEAAPSLYAWVCRMLLLVAARALFFAFAYVNLPTSFLPKPATAFLQVVAALILCIPILGFQHLSYLLSAPKHYDKPPSFLGPKSKASWQATSGVTGLIILAFVSWIIIQK